MQNGGLNIKKVKPCKRCNKQRYANLSFCFQHYRQMAKEKRLLSLAKKKERSLRKKEKKANSPKVLKKELDRVFSIYIRQRASDPQGNIICVACYRTLPWQEAQNMHYNGRAKMNTRWDEENCYAGCMRCNVFLNGNYPAFTRYLLDLKGEEWLKNLIRKGEQVRKWTPEDLKTLISKYSNNP